jgi:hypothetical protein
LRRRLGIAAVVMVFVLTNFVAFGVGTVRGVVLGRRGLTADDDPSHGGVCVDLKNTASIVPVVGGGSGVKPPPAKGGKIVDGTYHMTEFILYGAPAGYKMGTSSSTLRVSSHDIEAIAYTKLLFASDVTFGKGEYRINGNTMDMDLTCPPPNHPVSHDYTVDGDTFIVYSNERSGDVSYLAVITYKKI